MSKLKVTSINWQSINKKVVSAADAVKSEVLGNILLTGGSGGGGSGKGRKSILEGAQAFADILSAEIAASGMTDNAAGAVGQPSIGGVEVLGETSARITISLDGGSRTSLISPSGGYTGGGIDDIVLLLNNGYTASHSVYGSWPGHTARGEYIHSLASRPGYEFINRAIAKFDSVKDQYNITSITCEGVNT